MVVAVNEGDRSVGQRIQKVLRISRTHDGKLRRWAVPVALRLRGGDRALVTGVGANCKQLWEHAEDHLLGL